LSEVKTYVFGLGQSHADLLFETFYLFGDFDFAGLTLALIIVKFGELSDDATFELCEMLLVSLLDLSYFEFNLSELKLDFGLSGALKEALDFQRGVWAFTYWRCVVGEF